MARTVRFSRFFFLALLLWVSGLRAAPLEVHFIDVGQGDAMLIRSPGGKTVLIDAGTPDAGPVVSGYLTRLGVGKLDLAVGTHPHLDHVGGMLKVLQSHRPALFLDSGFVHPLRAYEKLVEWLEAEKVPVKTARGGRTITLEPGVTLQLLAPTDPFLSGTRSDANSNSVVARLVYGEVSVLFTGDSEADTEQRLLRDDVPIASTVLKVAHHGGKHSTTDRFLSRVSPKYAVISCGQVNRYGHPSPPTLEKLSRAGVKVFRTDDDGDVIARIDGRAVTWERTLERSGKLDERKGERPAVSVEEADEAEKMADERPAAPPAPARSAPAAAPTRPGPERKLQLNLATVDELVDGGFPLDAARRLYDRRRQKGPFREADEVALAAAVDEALWRTLKPKLVLRLELNRATESELVALGLTTTEARAVVDHRRARGAFSTLGDLAEVPGLLSRRREWLTPLVRLETGY